MRAHSLCRVESQSLSYTCVCDMATSSLTTCATITFINRDELSLSSVFHQSDYEYLHDECYY